MYYNYTTENKKKQVLRFKILRKNIKMSIKKINKPGGTV